MMQNRLDVPKVIKATPAPFQNYIASSPSSNTNKHIKIAEKIDNFPGTSNLDMESENKRTNSQD